jgi:hypothetical protein
MDGVPLEVVGKMLGHKNYRTTQRYSHIADTALREAVNKTSQDHHPRRAGHCGALRGLRHRRLCRDHPRHDSISRRSFTWS